MMTSMGVAPRNNSVMLSCMPSRRVESTCTGAHGGSTGLLESGLRKAACTQCPRALSWAICCMIIFMPPVTLWWGMK